MSVSQTKEEFERSSLGLNDPITLESYERNYHDTRVSLLPRLLGALLVKSGALLYGEPSYLKFRAVEVIARVPYQSWSSAAYTLLTLNYTNEQQALRLADTTRYARLAHDNETMHVVVISHLAKLESRAGFIRFTLIPMLFSFLYFWLSYVLYLIRPRWSYELNYLFEQHAFDQYSLFLQREGNHLKNKPVESAYLAWYGRHPANQYEFFRSVRNDELVHRNESLANISERYDDDRVDLLRRLFLVIAVALVTAWAIAYAIH